MGSFLVQAMGLEFDIEFERMTWPGSEVCENHECPTPRASPNPVDRRLAEVMLLLRERTSSLIIEGSCEGPRRPADEPLIEAEPETEPPPVPVAFPDRLDATEPSLVPVVLLLRFSIRFRYPAPGLLRE